MDFELSAEQDEELEINLTPLIDIVFLLLIFFMVSTTFKDSEALNVNLPTASKASTSQVAKEVITVNVSADGKIVTKGTRIPLATLEQQLTAAIKKSPETSVLIRADTTSTHGRVVEVLDTAKKVGVKKLSIAAEVE